MQRTDLYPFLQRWPKWAILLLLIITGIPTAIVHGAIIGLMEWCEVFDEFRQIDK